MRCNYAGRKGIRRVCRQESRTMRPLRQSLQHAGGVPGNIARNRAGGEVAKFTEQADLRGSSKRFRLPSLSSAESFLPPCLVVGPSVCRSSKIRLKLGTISQLGMSSRRPQSPAFQNSGHRGRRSQTTGRPLEPHAPPSGRRTTAVLGTDMHRPKPADALKRPQAQG